MGKINCRAGFTLLEMVVTVGILGVLSVGLTSIFLVTVRNRIDAMAQADVKSQADHAIITMERLIRNSVDMPTCSPDKQRLTFTVKDVNNPTTSYTYIYTLIGSNIDVQLGGTPPIPLGNMLGNSVRVTDSSSFDCGTQAVTVKLDVAPVSNPTRIQQFRTRVAIRNTPR